MDNTNGVVISELELRVSNDIDKDIENGINIDNDQNKEQNGISQENMDDEAVKGSNQKEDLYTLSGEGCEEVIIPMQELEHVEEIRDSNEDDFEH
ncbi:hypothetical protein K7X08_023155 [Anisodus acutangulus]|uniref:Uncharacterized protein n=1 Tax=Anisodus acutangulus TaxID=402998 RepID=A0A9Q1LFT7_9SOLA|nr:hypothetical protein K7X08_023155 [Anisodus acutangulus]